MIYDVLVLGATGSAGRLIAYELAARRLSVVLAGRDSARLAEVAEGLPPGNRIKSLTVDLGDPVGLERAVAGAHGVLSTVGPFARHAPPVVEACLSARVPYIDIANELGAVRALLGRDGAAREAGVTLVTGAGFGLVATETLVLRLMEELSAAPASVRVAAAPAVTGQSPGVRETVLASAPEGATAYVAGKLVRSPLGSGAISLPFGGRTRRVLPLPLGDLEAARLASGASDVVAYGADPLQRQEAADSASYAYAEVTDAGGASLTATLRLGEGVQASAAIAAEIAQRVLAGVAPGAWTPCRLLGAGLLGAAVPFTLEMGRPEAA